MFMSDSACRWRSRALKEYLGLNPNAPASTIEEMAQREGVKEQTVRNRINMAVHNLVNPAEALRREERKRLFREMMADCLDGTRARGKGG